AWSEGSFGRATRVVSEPWAGQTDSESPPVSGRRPGSERRPGSVRKPDLERRRDLEQRPAQNPDSQPSALVERTTLAQRTGFAQEAGVERSRSAPNRLENVQRERASLSPVPASAGMADEAGQRQTAPRIAPMKPLD